MPFVFHYAYLSCLTIESSDASDVQVCQMGVMTDSVIVTLTQDGAVDFKTAAVFLHLKFDQHRFSRVHATLQPALSVGRSVGRSHFILFTAYISLTV